jgi:hypothetical protein
MRNLVGIGGGDTLSWSGSSMKSFLFLWPRVAVSLLVCDALTAWTGSLGAITLLRTPGGGLQPQAMADSNGTLHLVYLKGDSKACDVFYTKRESGQTNFSAAIRVNDHPGSAVAIGTVRGAQIALGRSGRVHVAWNGSQEAVGNSPGRAPMLFARLNDAGTDFEPQRNLMTSTAHLDGGGSIAADEEGTVYVVWHGHERGAPPDELHRAVFFAKSMDDGKTFAPETQASPSGTGACGCCGLKAFADNRGRLAIIFRSATAGGDRDVTLLLSHDFGKTFQAKVLGPWRISFCPMSTMSLAAGPSGSLLAAWETAGQVCYSSITADPRNVLQILSPPRAPGGRKHPVLVSSRNGSTLLLAWTEGTGWAKGGSLVWQCVGSGQEPGAMGRVEGVPVWGLATAVQEKDGSFAIVY